MPIVRSHHESNFTALPNALLQDPRLSCCDLGLLVQMLSRPADWIFSTASLNKLYAGRTGKESLAKSIKNLQECGYLRITRERTGRGRLGPAIWTVYDSPQPGKPECGTPQPEEDRVDSPQSGKPESGFPPYTKERINKRDDAAPSFKAGEQPDVFYRDEKTGAWRYR